MQKIKKINTYTHFLIYFICALSYTYVIDLSMLDDGLRHIAFAANKEVMISWGNVYPNSLFTNYDPWFGWHFFLKSLLLVVPYDKVHLVINFFSLFSLMLLSHKIIEKYTKYNFSSLLYIIVFIIVLLTSFRYVMVRPDLLSGLYIMFAILLSNRFLPIFLLTCLYIPFYYLFFLYTGSLGLVYLIQKKFKLFFGVFLGSVSGLAFFLIDDYKGYLNNVYNILIDQSLRNGLAVTEGLPIFSILKGVNYYLLVFVFALFSTILIWKKYSYFKKNGLGLFLLITSILWVNQYRYFHLFLPLIFVYVFILITNLNKKRFLYYLRKYLVVGKRYFNYSKNRKLFYLIAIPYSIFMLSIMFSDHSYNKTIEKGKYFQDSRFDNKVILYSKMDTDMFSIHYYNPTIKIVPSCSIGWFENDNKEMRDIYLRLEGFKESVTEEELKKLIDFVKADYFIDFLKNENQKFDFEKLRSYGIIPEEIKDKKIIFRIERINGK